VPRGRFAKPIAPARVAIAEVRRAAGGQGTPDELPIGDDHETVHGLADPAALCHVSYVLEGQPYCTPALFWRENTRLYWHGSSVSRMLRNLSDGQSARLTVKHLDSLVLARSGFNHSADYRSMMAFGHARLVTDLEESSAPLS
jgi:nitroimidazol reductase NimA-like FMN-containing flavoprotein (pyridoxamine 5'-phosphate oxidase superfamily)